MYKRVIWTLSALFFMGFSLFSTAAQAENGWPRTINGAKGSITLQQAPQRIVSTSVTLTGSLLAINAPVIASGATAPNSRLGDAQGFFASGAMWLSSVAFSVYILASPLQKRSPHKRPISSS